MIMTKYFTHKNSLVESKNIGEGSRIWTFVHILPGAKIGKDANVCDHCFIENDVKIGNHVTIKSGVYLWDGITIEDNVMIGPAAVFTNDKYPRSKNKNYKQERTLLKKGSSIGANATIIAGIVIGQYALIGAGTVVTKDVPDFGLVYGNPAMIKGYVCVCGKKISLLKTSYSCVCGKKYKIKNSHVSLIP